MEGYGKLADDIYRLIRLVASEMRNKIDVCQKRIGSLESELESYKEKVRALSEELEAKKRDDWWKGFEEPIDLSEAGQGVIEAVPCDGLFRVGRKDVLVLKLNCAMQNEHIYGLQEEISERLGMQVVIIDHRCDVIGVIEYGS